MLAKAFRSSQSSEQTRSRASIQRRLGSKSLPCRTPTRGPRCIAVTSDDAIWYTDYARGYRGRLDPKTGRVSKCGHRLQGRTPAPMPSPSSTTISVTQSRRRRRTCWCASIPKARSSSGGRYPGAAASSATWRRRPAEISRSHAAGSTRSRSSRSLKERTQQLQAKL